MNGPATKIAIVVGWTVAELVYDGRPYRGDLGARPGFVTKHVPRACFWLRRGHEADVAKAREYAERENGRRGDGEGPIRVFTFSTSERDPIARAKRALEK